MNFKQINREEREGARRKTQPDRLHFAPLRVLRGSNSGQSGFALVITVVLLALLVLIVYAVSALTRIGSDISASDAYQAQARQHALLGLNLAVGALQRFAADDAAITGMAGITGIPEGPGQPARQWCGVWDVDGHFVRWLASVEAGPAVPTLSSANSIALVAAGSLGAEGPDREHVRAPVVAVEVTTPDRSTLRLGNYAWWVGDEGVKLSAVLPAEKHAIDEFITLPPATTALANTISYEQLSLVPATVSAAVLAGQLRASFHVLGRTHISASSAAASGRLNVNSTSARYWRGVAATYNRLKPPTSPAINVAVFAASMHDRIPPADPGAAKGANGPYPTVDMFLNSEALSAALGQSGGSLPRFGEVMRPWLAVRSDTFQVRAYGSAVNPSNPAQIESSAWCEAIVQRIKDDPAAARGRFIVTYFRWLSPDDI